MSDSLNATLPTDNHFEKKLFLLWLQGWANAPDIVKVCKDSWIQNNPDYEVVLLDKANLFDYVVFPKSLDFERADIPMQKIAALSRLSLLTRYGGVWADATTYCARPLDDWLHEHLTTGFFAFSNPGHDRMMANWFMASESNNLITQELFKTLFDFFRKNRFTRLNTDSGKRDLEKYSERWNKSIESTVKWHSFYAKKILRIYPYFVFHYTFNKIILENSSCSAIWNGAKQLPARPAFKLKGISRRSGDVEEAMQAVAQHTSPVYKLDWRYDTSSGYWLQLLNRLEKHHDRRYPN